MSGTTGTVPLQNGIPDQLITSALWNAELANIGSLMDAAGSGGHSGTDAEAQIQTAPFPGSVLSKATSIAGELERLRYQMAQILGTDYWYKPAATDLTSLLNSIIPIGGTIEYVVSAPPNSHFHLEDGAALSRTTYAALFALVGTTFGIGDGTTTFNIPDSRDRMSIGAGNLYAGGATGGEATHILTSAEVPATAVSVAVTDPGHSHAVTDPGHTHGVTDPGHTHTSPSGTNATSGSRVTTATNNTGTVTDNSATTGLTVNSAATGISVNSNTTGITAAGTVTGGGGAHNNLPPYIGKYKMIRVL